MAASSIYDYIPDKEFVYRFHYDDWIHKGVYDDSIDALLYGQYKIMMQQGEEEVEVQYDANQSTYWTALDFYFTMKPSLSEGTTHTVTMNIYNRLSSGEYKLETSLAKEFIKITPVGNTLTQMHLTWTKSVAWTYVAGFITGLGATGYTDIYLWEVSDGTGERVAYYGSNSGWGFPNYTTSTHLNFCAEAPYSDLPSGGSTVYVMAVNPSTKKYLVSQEIQVGEIAGYSTVGSFYPYIIYRKEKLLLLNDIAHGSIDTPTKVLKLPISGTINVGKGTRAFSTGELVNDYVAIPLLDSEIPQMATCTVTYVQDSNGGFSARTSSLCTVYESMYNDPTADDLTVRQLSESEATGIVHKLYPLATFPEGYSLSHWEVYYGAEYLGGTPDYTTNTISFNPPYSVEKNTSFNVVHRLEYYREDDGEIITIEKSAAAIYTYDLPLLITATDKYLYKRGGLYYTENEKGELVALGTSTPDDMTFYDHGVSIFSEEHLTNGTTLVYYRAEPNTEIPKISYKGTYQGCVVTMDWDIQSDQVTKFQLDGDIHQEDVVKFLMSNDSGKTWLTYDGVQIKTASLSEIKTTGTPYDVWLTLTSGQIAELRGSSNLLRLAIYIEQASVNSPVTIRHIRFRY